jgi:hypothetical protein
MVDAALTVIALPVAIVVLMVTATLMGAAVILQEARKVVAPMALMNVIVVLPLW